ncbi:permease [Herbaspirillum sp. HC18]|nr:permease [Herbaspirillum sp. HC18]
MQRVLSFEQTPSLWTPLRFFLTAPAFAIAAACLLFWYGPDAFQTRWSPVTLALTHLLTLGFLAMCMIGALLQILPVVAGIEVPAAKLTASAVHAMLATGAITLVAAFLTSLPLVFTLAILLLLSAFGWLLIALARRIWSAEHSSPMLTAIRFALTSLAIAVALGATAAGAFAWQLQLPLMQLTDVHAAWGLLGWVGLLVAGIAYQVVPMFQVTPLYPQWVTRYLTRGVFLLLAIWAAASFAAPAAAWPLILFAAPAAAYATFSLTTFRLLSQRKRPKPDPTTLFWRTALSSLLAAAALWAAGTAIPQISAHNAYPLALGILMIVGFGCSVINGMLYKIVPFLVWYHLQNDPEAGCAKAPNVKQILPDREAEKQFRLHLPALLLLLAATLAPRWFAHLAALAFAASSTILWLNLAKAARVYRANALRKP